MIFVIGLSAGDNVLPILGGALYDDRDVVSIFPGLGGGFLDLAAAGGQGQGHDQSQGQGEKFFHSAGSFFNIF